MYFDEFFEEFIFNCQSRNLADGTIKRYKKMLKLLGDFLKQSKIDDLSDITTKHIRHFMLSLKRRGNKETYINSHLKLLRSFFTWLEDEGYNDTNPTVGVKFFKEKKVVIKTFTDEEVLRMINVAGVYKYNNRKVNTEFTRFITQRNKLIIMLLADTAIRVNELCTIKNDDIYKDRILIREGKGNKERFVYLSNAVIAQMMKYNRTRKNNFEDVVIDDNLILSKNGTKTMPLDIQVVIKKLGKEANVRKEIRCSPHTLRHYSAQTLLKNGVDVYSVSRILGHSNTKITEVYLRSLETDEVLINSRNKSPLSLIKRKK